MTSTTYNTITAVLGVSVLVALAVMGISFVGMIVRWKTTKRRGHVVRLLIATAAIPCLIGMGEAIRTRTK